MKKYILLFISLFTISFIISFNAKAETFLLLECKPPRYSNEMSGLQHYTVRHHFERQRMGDYVWELSNRRYFKIILFGQSWEQVETMCRPFETSIELGTYSIQELYIEKEDCGKFGNGKWEIKDSFDAHRTNVNTKNVYNASNFSCTTTMDVMITQKKFKEVNQHSNVAEVGRKSCEMAKRHFYRGITDSNYSNHIFFRLWQDEKCKEISIVEFEKHTGISVKDNIRGFSN